MKRLYQINSNELVTSALQVYKEGLELLPGIMGQLSLQSSTHSHAAGWANTLLTLAKMNKTRVSLEAKNK